MLSRALDASGKIGGPSAPRPGGYQIWLRTTKEKGFFIYTDDTTTYSPASINVPATVRWRQYPILEENRMQSGYYRSFLDFRNARLIKDPIELHFDSEDSAYYFAKSESGKQLYPPWAVSEENRIFILLDKNRYLELNRYGNAFYFYIPHSLDDCYTLLNKPETTGDSSGWWGNPSLGDAKGNIGSLLLGALAYWIIVGTANLIEESIHSAHQKKVAEHRIPKTPNPDYGYRICYLDMDTGSFHHLLTSFLH